MRRPLLALVALGAAFACAPAAAGAANGEVVSMSVSIPAVVPSAIGFPVHVSVSSDPGALSTATAPLRVRVKAAAECGGSFDSTPGAVLLDKPLGPSGKVAGTGTTHVFGVFTACAFLEQQGDNRLFAFDDSTSAKVTHPCTTYTRRVLATKDSLAKVKRALRHAHGAHKAALSRRAAHLRAKLKKASAGRKRTCLG
jgi:hypothetical protein